MYKKTSIYNTLRDVLGYKVSNLGVALNMLKNKFKIDDIIKATGLSKEEILKLKEKN